jgi:hypothetical protein
MISAFFGTVIGMERAVASGLRWPFLAPLFSGGGGLVLLAGGSPAMAAGLMLLAACLLFATGIVMFKRHAAAFTLIPTLGALCWLAGCIDWLAALTGWLTGGGAGLIPAWLAFIILTIAGERLELTRFIATPALAKRFFALIVGVLILSLALIRLEPAAGLALYSAALSGLAIWLANYDIARRNLASGGLTQFIAICLMGGYIFLAVGGFLGLAGALVPGHRWYDAALHAVTLGFVFSMVLGHALIVLPAVARIRIPFGNFFYIPLAALHLSLYMRIAGSLAACDVAVRYGALGNALSLLLFIAALVYARLQGEAKKSR